MKETVCTVTGICGSFVATLFGGWSEGMTTLLILMIADYIAGLTVAGVFHKSRKTDNGALESRAGYKGLCKKMMTLILVMIGYRLDMIFGTDMIQNAIIIGFITNEIISLTENAGLMGIPIPAVITRAIDMLEGEADVNKNEEA